MVWYALLPFSFRRWRLFLSRNVFWSTRIITIVTDFRPYQSMGIIILCMSRVTKLALLQQMATRQSVGPIAMFASQHFVLILWQSPLACPSFVALKIYRKCRSWRRLWIVMQTFVMRSLRQIVWTMSHYYICLFDITCSRTLIFVEKTVFERHL